MQIHKTSAFKELTFELTSAAALRKLCNQRIQEDQFVKVELLKYKMLYGTGSKVIYRAITL